MTDYASLSIRDRVVLALHFEAEGNRDKARAVTESVPRDDMPAFDGLWRSLWLVVLEFRALHWELKAKQCEERYRRDACTAIEADREMHERGVRHYNGELLALDQALDRLASGHQVGVADLRRLAGLEARHVPADREAPGYEDSVRDYYLRLYERAPIAQQAEEGGSKS